MKTLVSLVDSKFTVWRLSAIWLFLVACLTANAPAQVSTASLTGQIADTSGAALVNARVTAENTATSVRQTVAANSESDYLFVTRPPGKYTISVELAGFKKAVRENIQLEVAQKARVDFTLQVGGIDESVIVSDSAPLLTTQEATPGAVVENKLITDLPLSARNRVSGLSLACSFFLVFLP
jgi:hypothetical protein